MGVSANCLHLEYSNILSVISLSLINYETKAKERQIFEFTSEKPSCYYSNFWINKWSLSAKINFLILLNCLQMIQVNCDYIERQNWENKLIVILWKTKLRKQVTRLVSVRPNQSYCLEEKIWNVGSEGDPYTH